ncbi:MAG: hypothetical protein U7127_21325 [Phormidium sp.]
MSHTIDGIASHDLDPKYKQIAQTEPAFDYIHNDEQLQQLVEN